MTYLYLFIFYLLLARLSESNMRFFLLKSKEEETSKLLLIWANIICHTFNTLTLDLVLPCFWPVLLARTRDKLAYFRTSLVLFTNFNSKLIVIQSVECLMMSVLLLSEDSLGFHVTIVMSVVISTCPVIIVGILKIVKFKASE